MKLICSVFSLLFNTPFTRLTAARLRLNVLVQALGFTFFITLFAIHSPQIIAAELKMPVNEQQQHLTDLLRYLPSDEVKTIMAGEQEMAVVISEQSGHNPRGIAILLPDLTLHATQSQAFLQLRFLLNDYGWVTLGGVAPDPIIGVSLMDDETAKHLLAKPGNGAEQIKLAEQQQSQSQLALIMSALYTEAQNYPGLILIVAQGATAGWLVESYQNGEIQLPDALVLIAPYLPDYQLNKTLPAKIAQLTVPILDVWSSRDNRWALATVEQRNKASKKYLTLHYRQRELFGLQGLSNREHRLAKEIYGYMTYLGW